jgi:hypothetical protein
MADELDRFCSEVYGYLRATNNAVCTNRGSANGRNVVWSLAAAWIESSEPVVLKVATSRAPEPTRAEKKLTPHEAGEDREPQPVTVTKVTTTTTTEDTYMTTATAEAPETGKSVAQQQAVRHREILECIEDTVKKAAPQPMTVIEVAVDLGIHDSPARHSLMELVEEGKLFARTETSDERSFRFGGGAVPSNRATLFSSTNPVPERTERVIVPGVVSTAEPRTPSKRHANDQLVLAAMKSGRWERATVITKRSRVPQGSITMVLRRLVASGKMETKFKKIGKSQVRLYRLAPSVTKPEARTENPPVVHTPPVPISPTAGSAREIAVKAVEALVHEVLAANAQSPEIARLEAELASANARVAELEAALAPLQALLGRDV